MIQKIKDLLGFENEEKPDNEEEVKNLKEEVKSEE